MEQVNTIPAVQLDIDPNASFTLEQARERIRTMLAHDESNAWDLGDLLNTIEKRGLARSEGYGKTRKWLEAEVPEAEGRMSTLSRYATVASHYTKEQVRSWGMNKLEYLMIHDRQSVGETVAGDLSDREVELLQEDGSTVAKRFRDCTCRELRQSNQLRRKGRKSKDEAAAPRPDTKAPRPEAAPETELRSIKESAGLLALGMLVSIVSGFLPDSNITVVLLVVGTGVFMSGVAVLIRHWHFARERLLTAFQQGRTIDLLKEHGAKARRGAQHLAAILRSRVTKRPALPKGGGHKPIADKAPEEETPPEKKAA